MFYDEWQKIRSANLSDEIYIRKFLDFASDSISIFNVGDKSEVLTAIKLLLSIPVTDFINAIDHPYDYMTKDIFQYSKLEDAIEVLCNTLEYEEIALSYEEIGKRLVCAPKQYANIKYGENHAKTAAMLSLVVIGHIEGRDCSMVSISSLGSVMTSLSKDERTEVVRRLAIRNPFLKTLLYYAKIGEASYVECVSKVLSGQTIIRRKHNNEILMNIILGEAPIKNKIRWK